VGLSKSLARHLAKDPKFCQGDRKGTQIFGNGWMSNNREIEAAKCLALEPEIWEVGLADGQKIHVLADSWGIEGDDCVFSLLFEGKPPILVDSLRIPFLLLGDYWRAIPE